MSDDIKKLLSIMNETTTSGAVAPVAGGMGKSMLKRPADSIFAAESVPQDADTGLEAAPKVDSPANFGMWKNSVLTGKKKNKLREATEREQEVIDSTRRGRQNTERNAGLNEPDELSMPGKEVDVGTWHFVVDGVPMKKDGKVYYSSSKKHNEHVLAHLRKKAEQSGDLGVSIAVVQGPVKSSNSRELPVDMDDWTEDDWAEWDAKVDRVGAKAKSQDSENQAVAEMVGYNQGRAVQPAGRTTGGKNPFSAAANSGKSRLQQMKDAGKKDWFSIQEEDGEKLDEYSEWDGTGDQDTAAAIASSGYEAGFADIEDKTSLSEAEITEEMIADRLKNELALMKKGDKPKDKSISKKPADKEVQPKDQKKESDEPKAKPKKSEPKKEKSDKEESKKSEPKKSEGKK